MLEVHNPRRAGKSGRHPSLVIVVLALHFLLGAGIVAIGDRLGRRAFLVAAAAPLAALVWLGGAWSDAVNGQAPLDEIGWVPELGLTILLRADALTATMVALVSGVGLLVCLYAYGYFSHAKPGTARLAGLLTMFAGAMLGLVMSDHLISLFVFWELTSITSYLLIGNDDRNPKARDSALAAIFITGAGGLAMLAGLILVGGAAGTYRLSELTGAAVDGATVATGAALVLAGAFTKSAQVPFHGWLPGAMVAPTPISTYLHAATMVKAGVYLVARLAPALADVALWRPTILVVGSATMLLGGWRAMRQHDLKLLLAYGTVSQLGFMMLMFGMGSYELAQAGVVLLIAHGAFKAALFMVVGVVDHQAGTRDVRVLPRPGPGWVPTVAVAVAAAASMAGLPPLVGFIAKEKGLGGALHGEFAGASLLVIVFVVGSVLTVAYSGRFVLGVLGRLAEEPNLDPAPAPAPSFVGPAIVVAGISVAAGVAPVLIDSLVRAATVDVYADAKPKAVQLWAGVNTALGLSAIVIAVGASLIAAAQPVERFQTRAHGWIAQVPEVDRSFRALIRVLLGGARRVTRIVQNGSLPIYLMIILAVAAIAPLVPAWGAIGEWPDLAETWIHVPIAVLIVVAAVGATVVHRRIAAALMLGAVGFAMAGFYVVQGAPDLALTQFAIETLATVLFVLVLRFLPREFADRRSAILFPVRILVTAAVGVSVFVLAIVAAGARADVRNRSISEEMVARSVPEAKGSNVVNVILVDFRGLDTLGEITVLVVAGLGVVALARTAYVHDRSIRAFARLPLVEVSSRLVYASMLMLSLYFLFAGHNQPGGGFVGGLTAGAAISLRYVAGGVGSVRRAVRVPPWTVLGGGLAVSAATALLPLLTGGAVLEHMSLDETLPVLGTIKTSTALPFDIGVYLVVVGLVLMAYEAFGDEADIEAEDTTGVPVRASRKASA